MLHVANSSIFSLSVLSSFSAHLIINSSYYVLWFTFVCVWQGLRYCHKLQIGCLWSWNSSAHSFTCDQLLFSTELGHKSHGLWIMDLWAMAHEEKLYELHNVLLKEKLHGFSFRFWVVGCQGEGLLHSHSSCGGREKVRFLQKLQQDHDRWGRFKTRCHDLGIIKVCSIYGSVNVYWWFYSYIKWWWV